MAPFTTEILKGFLSVFLLDMGITSGRKIKSCLSNGVYPIAFAIIVLFTNDFLGFIGFADDYW